MFIIQIVNGLLDVIYTPSSEADVFIKAWEREKKKLLAFSLETVSSNLPSSSLTLSPYGWYGRCKFLPLSLSLSHTHTSTHSLTHTHLNSLSLSHINTQVHTHTFSHIHILSHTHVDRPMNTRTFGKRFATKATTTTSSVRKRKKKREKIVCEREREAIKVKIPIVSLLEASVRLDPRSTLLLSYKEWLFFSRQEQVFWFLHTLLTDRTFSFCDIKISFWNVC